MRGERMKLTPRGEIVFASLLFSAFVMLVGATAAGINFLATHERVTIESSCVQTPDGLSCDWEWVRK